MTPLGVYGMNASRPWRFDMAKRFKMKPKASRRMFIKGASKTHSRNVPPPRRQPMRGGIRL